MDQCRYGSCADAWSHASTFWHARRSGRSSEVSVSHCLCTVVRSLLYPSFEWTTNTHPPHPPTPAFFDAVFPRHTLCVSLVCVFPPLCVSLSVCTPCYMCDCVWWEWCSVLKTWHSGNWILHHDNDPVHRAITTNEFLSKHNISSLPQPPYSPDLAPCDFFLFPQLKKTMKGHRFDYVEDNQANMTRQLRAITKSGYQRYFHHRQERWNKCIQGHFFEGDKTN
jgi:transposase